MSAEPRQGSSDSGAKRDPRSLSRLGLVVGGHWHSLAASLGAPSRVRPSEDHGPGGDSRPELLEYPEFALLARHGSGEGLEGDARYALPHEIDHRRNMESLAEAGCDRVLAIGSVGGLRPDLGPGTVVCPDDFIALDVPHRTALTGMAAHRVPGFDREWRGRVLAAFAAAKGEALVDFRDGGVYWQATGPRLETPAEIRFVAQYADVIGMTVASECVAAGEAGLRYAALCLVDNFANGVAETELTLAEVEAGRARNRAMLAAALAASVPRLV